jgi:hypothetical protein
MPQDEKRRLRREKKAIKREGTRRARRELARGLREHPDEAQFDEVDFGMARSEVLNGKPRVREDERHDGRVVEGGRTGVERVP